MVPLAWTLHTRSDLPLYRRVYGELREAILSGRLPAGSKLPSTRQLAADLNISRNTVLNAYEQLLAEGYIYGTIGSGSYVAGIHPAGAGRNRSTPSGSRAKSRLYSRLGSALASTSISQPTPAGTKFSFKPGTPALESFLFAAWGKLLTGQLRSLRARDFHYSDPAGYYPLREAIAAYLFRSRGVRCTADQILIVNGSQQAMDLCCRILLNPDETAWMEDPGYRGARGALRAAGARIVPVPLDSEGLQWKTVSRSSAPRIIYITPSHQFPMGITMSLPRRLSLLKFAHQNHAWILEDDYDSEFRYDGRPLAALQGIDENGRVLYTGTFSKVLFAALRIGYLVVPPDMIRAFVNAKAILDRHSPLLEQAALAQFIVTGRFERHIRDMRKLYAKRQKKLVDSVNYFFRGKLEVRSRPAGMHLIGWLPEGVDDRKVCEQAASHGIEVVPLSLYAEKKPSRGGLLLGYSALPLTRIDHAIRALASLSAFASLR